MPRRRALTLIFASLIVVFVAGSVFTVVAVRDQLIDAADDDLDAAVDGVSIAFESLDADQLGELTAPEAVYATLLVTNDRTIELLLPAGNLTQPLPIPLLDAAQVVERLDDTFTVGSDGGPDYRVRSRRLASSDIVTVARPLDDVDATLESLSQTLLVTLFAIVAVLGLVFWRILRRSLEPYESIVQTSKAIAAGDLDRRAIDTGVDPDVSALTASINTMLDRIQLSFEERNAAEARGRQFAADASHELRTPLTTITGYSDVYLSGAATDPAAVTKQMTRINGEATRMAHLVNDLLILTRLDSNRAMRHDTVDVARLVDAVVGDRRISHPHQRIDVVDAAAHRSIVDGDEEALYQVLANLLANADLHASGATCRVTITQRRSSSTDGPGDVVVVVGDDGPGMDPDFAQVAFDRFSRADRARSSQTSSTGLGLSIVAGIVKAHGGHIDLATEPGAGADFTIRLPRAIPDGPARPDPRSTGAV